MRLLDSQFLMTWTRLESHLCKSLDLKFYINVSQVKTFSQDIYCLNDLGHILDVTHD